MKNDKLLQISDISGYLQSPDTNEAVEYNHEIPAFVSGEYEYPVIAGIPMLFLQRFIPHLGERCLDVPFGHYEDPILQYGLLSSIKQGHDYPNSPHDSPAYHEHVEHMRWLLRDVHGSVLDIGCDSPSMSASFLPDDVRYIGLDPIYRSNTEFKIGGMAEFLPFRADAFDNVLLISNLDHILDYHRAIDEAGRALRPGGSLFVQCLMWTERAEVYYDHLHFHHFREEQFMMAFADDFELCEFQRHPWKGDTHRSSVYIKFVRRQD